MGNSTVLLLHLVPSLVSLAAIAPLEIEFYKFVRVAICLPALGIIVLHGWVGDLESPWTPVFGLMALLFNPIVPLPLPREVWLPINIIVPILFLCHGGWLWWVAG